MMAKDIDLNKGSILLLARSEGDSNEGFLTHVFGATLVAGVQASNFQLLGHMDQY